MSDRRPIGVFDSGVGGITVLRALRERLPGEDLIYLGDTARLPYGTKSAQTVTRYAMQAARALVARDVKLLVIACNTASAVATAALAAAFAPVPVVGVIEPGAEAAAAATRGGTIAVIATEGTVEGGAYPRAIRARAPAAPVVQKAATVFVALAEEGWTEGPVAEAAARAYLAPLFEAEPAPDTLLLGCTHFPVLAGTIRAELPRGVALVDSATTTAAAVDRVLADTGLARPTGEGEEGGRTGEVQFLATDGPARFARVGRIFFGAPIAAGDVELIDL